MESGLFPMAFETYRNSRDAVVPVIRGSENHCHPRLRKGYPRMLERPLLRQKRTEQDTYSYYKGGEFALGRAHILNNYSSRQR